MQKPRDYHENVMTRNGEWLNPVTAFSHYLTCTHERLKVTYESNLLTDILAGSK